MLPWSKQQGHVGGAKGGREEVGSRSGGFRVFFQIFSRITKERSNLHVNFKTTFYICEVKSWHMKGQGIEIFCMKLCGHTKELAALKLIEKSLIVFSPSPATIAYSTSRIV